MKVSLCMIAKNAAAEIRQSLQSLQGQADELIVVDTGSTDATAAIARSCGARVYGFAWRDDFAAAKNFALTKARGEWIVFLDADEYFAQGTGAQLRRVLEKYAEAQALLIKMVNVDADQGNAGLDAFYTARVFRNAPQICYQGRIHEQICRTDGRPLRTRQVLEQELLLYHSGYSTGRLREKAQRNLRVLLSELEDGRDPAQLYAYLAEAYAALEQEEEALRYARLDIARGRQSVTYASRSYRVGIEALKALQREPEALEEMLRQAMRDFPEIPDFCAEYGLFCYRQKRFAEARALLAKALRLQAEYRGLEPSVFYQSIGLARQLLAAAETELKQENKQVKTIKLSACVIAKNEAKHLPCWLECMRRCADEMIVVDTGSADQTKQRALAAGATVYDFPWRQDFAAAKNFAKEKAAGDWILFLDADELFAASVTKAQLCEAALQAQAAERDAVVCTLVNIDPDREGREISRFSNVRLFRNADTLYYRGAVHENLVSSRGELRLHMRQDLVIYHTGYASAGFAEKQRRNLAILLREIEAGGEQPRHYQYLSDCYFSLGDYAKAIHYAKLHLAAGLPSLGSESAVYKTLAAALALTHAPEEEVQAVLDEALARFPQTAEFHAQYGESLWRQEAFKQAKGRFLEALEAAAQTRPALEIDQFAALRDCVLERLGEIALMEEEEARAVAYFKQVLQCNPYNAEALRYLLLLLLREGEAEAREQLAALYGDTRRDLSFVLDVLEQTQIGGLYRLYAEKYAALDSDAQERLTQYERFAAGDLDGAWQAVWRTLPLRLQNYSIACFLAGQTEPVAEPCALPEAFANLLRRYQGGAALGADDYAAYKALLPEILRHEGSDMLRRYVEVGLDFCGDACLEIGQILFARELYAAAASFYGRFAAEGGEMTLRLQYEAGVACYSAGAYDSARSHLLAARPYEEKRWEIDSYLVWIEEKLSNG